MKKIWLTLAVIVGLGLTSCDKVKSMKDSIFGSKENKEMAEDEDEESGWDGEEMDNRDYEPLPAETTTPAVEETKRTEPQVSGEVAVNAPASEEAQAVAVAEAAREQVQAVKEQVAVASDPEQVYSAVEQPAEFPGGTSALMTWLGKNIAYPEAAQQNGISGRVIVKFIVEKDGSISGVSVVKGVDKDLDNEAIRVVKKMPKWQPGKNGGKAVRCYFSLPVTFRLDR